LGLSGRFEALRDALASSGRLVTVFGSIVQAFVLAMLHTRPPSFLRGGIAGQLVRDHHAWSDTLLLAQQALRRFGIAPALDQDVEHDPMLIHGSPKPVLPARDIDRHLIKVPFVPSCRKTPADLIGKALVEF
jgi:hypothetical protein